MDPTQYLAFVPLLIYGMSITNIMTDWRRFFDSRQFYLPYLLFSLLLLEVAIYNVFIYIRLIGAFKEQNYIAYLLFLLPPTVFYITTHVFTPDAGTDTKTYFTERLRLFYMLLAMIMGSHFLYNLEETRNAMLMRISYILFLLVAAYFKRAWLSYVVVLLWLLSFLVRGEVMVR